MTNTTIALVSIASIGAAVVTMQDVDAQNKTLQATKKAAYGVVSGATQQNAKVDGAFVALRDICHKLCIPGTTGRLRRMVEMSVNYPSLDWKHLFDQTKEDPMTDANKTAAYNAVKMALSRMKKAEEKAAEQAAAMESASEQERLNQQALLDAEEKRIEAEEQAEFARLQAAQEKQALEASILAAIEAKESMESELFRLRAENASLQADNATLQAKLDAMSSKATKKTKATA